MAKIVDGHARPPRPRRLSRRKPPSNPYCSWVPSGLNIAQPDSEFRRQETSHPRPGVEGGWNLNRRQMPPRGISGDDLKPGPRLHEELSHRTGWFPVLQPPCAPLDPQQEPPEGVGIREGDRDQRLDGVLEDGLTDHVALDVAQTMIEDVPPEDVAVLITNVRERHPHTPNGNA